MKNSFQADMYQMIFELMMQYHISEEELKGKREIKLENGQVLSYDFYLHTFNYQDNWNVDTEILYGEHDEISSFREYCGILI